MSETTDPSYDLAQLPAKIREGLRVDPDGCWRWTRGKGHGYGVVRFDGAMRHVHRVAYRLLVGPIPEGMTLDHECHNASSDCAGGAACEHRACANPAHLAVRTKAENTLASPTSTAGAYLRRTHCRNGHEFTPENTAKAMSKGRPYRACLECRKVKNAKRRICRAIALVTMITSITIGGATAAHAERPNGGRHHQPNLSSSPADLDTVPGLSTARAEADVLAVASYLHDLDVQAAVSYVAAVQDAEVRAYADAVARSRPQVQYAPRVSSVTGDCYGSQVPDYIVNRESGGNPGAYNPSGAWGCFQIMPGTWAGAGCNQFGAYGSASADAQKQCADIIWNGGAGASNWVTA